MPNLKRVGISNSCNRNLSLLFTKGRGRCVFITSLFAILSRIWERNSQFVCALAVAMLNLIEEVAQKEELHVGKLGLWEISPPWGRSSSRSRTLACSCLQCGIFWNYSVTLEFHYFVKLLLCKDEQCRHTLLKKEHIADIKYFQKQQWNKTK